MKKMRTRCPELFVREIWKNWSISWVLWSLQRNSWWIQEQHQQADREGGVSDSNFDKNPTNQAWFQGDSGTRPRDPLDPQNNVQKSLKEVPSLVGGQSFVSDVVDDERSVF